MEARRPRSGSSRATIAYFQIDIAEVRTELACAQNDIDHRLTKALPSEVGEVKHPCTNGQVDRMNRTIKDATVKRYRCGSHDQLRQHLGDLVDAYDFARRLKTLRGLTP